MLKITPSTIRKHRYAIIAVILALIVLVIALAFITARYSRNERAKPDEQSTPLRDPGTASGSYQSDANPTAPQTGVPGIETSPETGASSAFPTTKPNLSVKINKTSQTDHKLIFDLSVTPSANGECQYELSKDSEVRAKSSSILSDGRCQDASLDISGVEKGSWTATVKIFAGSNVASSSRSISIR